MKRMHCIIIIDFEGKKRKKEKELYFINSFFLFVL